MSSIKPYDYHRVVKVRSAPDYITNPVVQLDDIKNALYIPLTDTTDDDYLLGLQNTVILWLEAKTWRKFGTYELTLEIDHFPGEAPKQRLASDCINPPRPQDCSIKVQWTPIQSVDEIRLNDFEGTETTYSTDNYVVDLGSDSYDGRIFPANNDSYWSYSVTLRDFSAVEIDYTTGYTTVPQIFKDIITRMVTYFYTNRGDCSSCDQCSLECGANLLLGPYLPVYL